MTKQNCCVLVALLLIVLANLCETQRIPQKKVNGVCTYDPTDRALTLEFYADYDGDPVNKVLAINGRVYDRANNNEASPACVYTFRDGSSEKILIRSTLYIDGSQTDVNPCGGRRTNPNSANSFEWTISLREHFAEKIYTEMDRRYLIICIIADTPSPYVTTNFQVFGADEEEDAMRVRPSNEMSVLEQVGGNYQLVDATVDIGQQIKFRIQSNLHESYQNHLFHYGIMAFSCIRSTSASFQNPTTFIGSNGCQAVTDPFGLTQGFTKAAVLVEPGGYYRLETEAFIFAPTRPSRKRYFIACYLAYCYGVYDANNPTNNDARCENFCAYNSNGKRKRRSESLSDNDRVILTVDVDTSSTGDNKPNESEKSQQTTLIAVTTVIGALILGIIIIIAILLLVARRRRYKDDTSSQCSSNDLPIQTVMKT